MDSYENLTYKSVSILFWSREFCASAGWVIKSDDDIIVNPFNFAKQFPPEYIESTTWQPLIYGLVMPHSKVGIDNIS